MKQYDIAINVTRYPIKKKNAVAEFLRDIYKVEEKNLFVSETCVAAHLNSYTSGKEPNEIATEMRDGINAEIGETCGFCITIYRIMPPVIFEYDMEE